MKKHEEKEANNERWLLTYSDLITLLMIFFVVMYASSNVSASKYKALSDSFKVALGGGKTIIGKDEGPSMPEDSQKIESEVVPKESDNNASALQTEENKLKDVKKSIDTYLEQSDIKSSVDTNIEERGLVISLKDTMFFDSGKAAIIEESKKKIIELGNILNKLDNYIRIEGHTDNVPIHNSSFNSNWELSVIRATNVTELLIEQSKIPAKRLSAVGYGEFRPIDSNDTIEGRSKNRRVDIVILNTKYNKAESND